MPGLNGIEVCRQITQFRTTTDSPIAVLMLTGRENKEDLTQALEAGADDFVGKSNDIAVLKGRIRALLRRKFFQEENRRIIEELKNKELETLRARAAQEVAEARVALMGELERTAAELRRSQDELRAAKDIAERANSSKGAFLANMSHEIRTPMNGILGMTELLMNTPLPRDQRDYLGTARESAESLLRLLDDILDFSKIEAGKLELEAIPFRLRRTIDDTVHPLGLRATQKGLELACHVAPDVPDALVGDPGRLRQVVVNLVGNAIKFTEAGEVVVEVRAEPTGLPSPAAGPASRRTLHFSVRDTGIGIPADKQGLIFEAFAQVDSSTTRRYGGTGLGLAISAELIARIGGRLDQPPPVNWAEVLDRVGGDRRLLAELIGLFVAEARLMSPELRTAATSGDAARVGRAAHRIKGSLATFAAPAALASAARLEDMGRRGDLNGVDAAVAEMEGELGCLVPELTRFAAGGEDTVGRPGQPAEGTGEPT